MDEPTPTATDPNASTTRRIGTLLDLADEALVAAYEHPKELPKYLRVAAEALEQVRQLVNDRRKVA